ncbi:RhuM family protein [Chromohalobacter japonicus]|uniref:RhuM family protein n=1 Tax=Chromohalobacter japonicus TaxID=223900 RepID=UPI0035EC5215
MHVRNILKEGELSREAVVKESLTTAYDGKRYKVNWYRLPMILAVGYRVHSPRGTQFRQWTTANLSEYLIKGFVMNDERLKEPGGWDYFDELLARLRDIRASEKRFYQKVGGLFTLSSDYHTAISAWRRYGSGAFPIASIPGCTSYCLRSSWW